MKRSKHYPVFKKTLADELVASGHTLARIRKNKSNPNYDVFYFIATDKFKQALGARKKA